jgi:alkylation response protein AidB-like acyl-CoA dehydrogenase
VSIAERGSGLALRAVRTVSSSDLLDRLGLRDAAERVLYRGTRDGFRAVSTAGRTFNAAAKRARPARPATTRSDLFDLTPTDEQAMLQEAFGDFATEKLRPAALDADMKSAAPPELLAQAEELGLAMLGVPEELGGAVAERSAVTTVLAAEALAHGDMGLAVAALAPAGVATALTLWGDEHQQATYLPPFVEDERAPVAALALLEQRAAFDPFALTTRARSEGDDYVLSGLKTLVPRGAEAELLLVGAKLDDGRQGLFLVEPNEVEGVEARPAPAMGLRAAATADVRFIDVRLPASALVGGGDAEIFAECVQRARLAWCAVATGTARAVRDYVVPYVNERQTFGEPISHRQSVAFAVADIAIELEGMRLLTLRAAARADAGSPFAREVAVARDLCTRMGMKIGSDGVQLLGGHGYVREHPVERWYRDLRAVGVMEGALLV